MKKISKPLSVMAWVLLASLSLFAFSVNAQCPPSSIPFGSIDAPTSSGDTVNATTCAFAGEYSTFTNLTVGETYRAIVSTTTGSGDPYLTLYAPGDTINQGFAFTSRAFIAAGTTIEVHVTQSDTSGNFCLSESACHVVAMECISCDTPILGCTDPLALNFDSLANTDDGSCVFPVPTNDSCSQAIMIACGGVAAGTTMGANSETGIQTCGTTLNTAAGVWYTYTATADELVTVSLAGSSYDTKLGVFSGTNCDSLVCVGGNDDFIGLQSQVTFTATSGETYKFYVTGFSTAEGNYNIAVTCEAVVPGCTDPNALNFDSTANVDDGSCLFPPPPANDSCQNAIMIPAPSDGSCVITSANTAFATPSDLSSVAGCDVGTNNWDIWYTFIATTSAYEIDLTLGTASLVEGAVYDSCGGPTLSCFFNAAGGQITGLTVGNTYVLQLWTDDFGTFTNAGSFDFCLKALVSGCTDPTALNFDSLAVVDDGSCVYPPCSAGEAQIAIEVTIGAFAGEVHWTLTSAAGDTVAEVPCGFYAGAASGDMFTTIVCIDTCGDYVFNAYDDWGDGWNGGSYLITNLDDGCELAAGSPSNGLAGDASDLCDGSDLEETANVNTCNIVGCTNPLATNFNPCATIDDGGCLIAGCTDPNALNFDSTANVDDGSCLYVTPANDLCDDAITIACGDTVSGTTQGASADTSLGICGTSLITAGGVWYEIIGTGDIISASTCGSGYDTKLGVFEGTCDSLICIDGNDDACGLQSIVQWNSTLGTTYYVYVTGFSTAAGSFTLEIECANAPANDLCDDALQVSCGSSITGSTSFATNTGAPGTCGTGASTAGGVWYFYVGNGDSVIASMCGSTYDTKIFVYEAAQGCDSLVCVTGNDDFCGLQSQVSWGSNSGTVYLIYVAGFGSSTGDFTLQISCVAPPCNAPTGLTDNNTTTTTTTLSWNAVPSAVGYQLTGGRVGFPPIAPITLGPATSFNVVNLVPSACYYWQVRAVCDVSGSTVSAYSSIDTFCMADPCPVPVPIFETNLTSTSVTLNWSVVAGANGYQIYGKAAASSNIVVLTVPNPAQSSFQVNNLPPNTTFQWAMRASCTASGFSLFTPINTFTTLPGPAPKTELDNVFNTGDIASLGVEIYPNPTSNVVNLKFTDALAEDVRIEMIDMSGKTISLTDTRISDGNIVTIDASDVANGIYQVVITSGDEVIVERVMIAR